MTASAKDHGANEIEKCFRDLQLLQKQAFNQIGAIAGAGDQIEGPAESQRTSATRKVQHTLNSYRDLLDILKTQINSSGTYDHYKEDYTLFEQRLKHLRARLRESQVLSNSNEQQAINKARLVKYMPVTKELEHLEAREQLFAGRSTKKSKETVDDQIFAKNKSITMALQSTRQMMVSSVVQTELNIESLDQQTKDINQLSFKLSDLTLTLGKSRNIVRFIEQQDKKDKKRIYLSIGFLVLCSVWVLWRRILRVPVRLFLWTFFKVFRVFTWFLPNFNPDFSTETDIAMLASISTSSTLTVSEAIATAIILVASDVIIDIDTNNPASTWQDVVSTAVEYVKDEL